MSEESQRGFLGTAFLAVFLCFNVFMIVWMLRSLVDLGDRLDRAGPEREMLVSVGGTLDLGFLLFVWACGAAITGALAVVARRY